MRTVLGSEAFDISGCTDGSNMRIDKIGLDCLMISQKCEFKNDVMISPICEFCLGHGK